jgi:nucleotide-binding universal stress UspA family protein
MVHYARTLAEKYGSEIILLHIINPVFIAPDIGMAPPAVVAVPQWLIEDKAKQLEAFAKDELAHFRVRRLVYEGIPEAQIADVAETENVDLVVMPTHGYGVFRRFLIGSVAAKVLDDVACPVLTGIHMEKHAHDQQVNISTITCAIDLNEGSRRTLAQAAKLATNFGAKLGVVYVKPSMKPGRNVPLLDELRPQLEELVRQELAQQGIEFAPENLVSCVQEGEVAQTVCQFAERTGSHLLVIGRGDSATGARLGLHTYSIVRQSPCPVLSV